MTQTSFPLQIKREYLHVDDIAKMGANAVDFSLTSTPQGAKVLAAITLASQAAQQGYADSTVFINGPVLMDGTQLDIPTSGMVRILGAGSGPSRQNSASSLYWSQDLGARKYGISFTAAGLAPRIEHLTLAGPYADTPILGGAEPVLMSGMFLGTRCIIDSVRSMGFNAGAELINDHQELRDFDAQGNVYGLKFGPNPLGGQGDIRFERLYLTNQSRASIACADSALVVFGLMTQGHIGAAPYGIWRYPHFYTATGSGASATITAVNITEFVPTAGLQVTGPNIPAGTVIAPAGVAGTSGNYSLTLSATPTGTVTKVMVGSRNSFLTQFQAANQSFEGCDQEIYDEAYDVWGVGGGGINFALNGPGESSTFAATTHWKQANVAATGSAASNQLTGVAVTNFVPQEGMEVNGTNIALGTRIIIGGVSGSSGNYTLTLNQNPTGAVTQVTVTKPITNIANIDGYQVSNAIWRDGYPFFQAPHALINAALISGVQIDDPSTIVNEFIAHFGDGTCRPFKIKGAYSASSTALTNVHLGRGTRQSGALLGVATIVDENVSRGDLLEANSNFTHAQKYRGTGQYIGAAADDFSQGEVAISWYSVRNNNSIVVRNRTASSIASRSLLKPDFANPGGVVAAPGYDGSKTFDWPSVANGANSSTTVTVAGVVLGDFASAAMSIAVPAGARLDAAVTAADTVTVTLTNNTGSALDLGSGTLEVTVPRISGPVIGKLQNGGLLAAGAVGQADLF